MQSSEVKIFNTTFISYILDKGLKDTEELVRQIKLLEFKFRQDRIPVQTSEYYRRVKCSECNEDKGLVGPYLDFFIKATNKRTLRIVEVTCKHCIECV